MHYKRIWRGGTAEKTKTVPKGKSLDYNLRHYGWTVTESGCWEYNGYQHPLGYGFVYSGGQTWQAHRAAYTAWVGPIADGLFVCHSCDNRICINPEHLWLGTNQDNMDDMKKKGRARNGETGPIREED